MVMERTKVRCIGIALSACIAWGSAGAQGLGHQPRSPLAADLIALRDQDQDTTVALTKNENLPAVDEDLYNAWGVDILISNDGFGLGTFYRRQFSPDLFGFVTFSVSESKDAREVERFDPFLQVTFVPGKLNRFFVIPLMFGIQNRLFREDILDTFRPYVNAGIGPTMIFVTPFTSITGPPDDRRYEQVEFFKSLGRGRAHYTAGGFIGIGANFGSEKSTLFGINFRYYFTYLFSDGIPSLFNVATGDVAATKTSFGGFFITLNVGTAY
jgi:hypothetical protein